MHRILFRFPIEVIGCEEWYIEELFQSVFEALEFLRVVFCLLDDLSLEFEGRVGVDLLEVESQVGSSNISQDC